MIDCRGNSNSDDEGAGALLLLLFLSPRYAWIVFDFLVDMRVLLLQQLLLLMMMPLPLAPPMLLELERCFNLGGILFLTISLFL